VLGHLRINQHEPHKYTCSRNQAGQDSAFRDSDHQPNHRHNNNHTYTRSTRCHFRFKPDEFFKRQYNLVKLEPFTTSKNWELTSGNGVKTVTAKFMDNAGLTATAFCAVTLQTIQPSPTATQSPTITPTEEPPTAPTTTPTTQPTQNPTASPEATPKIPELQVGIVLAVFVVLTIALLVIV